MVKVSLKEEVGADFIQTQVVFDVDTALRFLEAAKHINLPILIGVFPPRSYGQADYFSKYVPGVKVPPEFLEQFRRLKTIPDKKERRQRINAYNIEYFTDFIKEVKKQPACKGIHIMAVGYPEVVAPIIEKV